MHSSRSLGWCGPANTISKAGTTMLTIYDHVSFLLNFEFGKENTVSDRMSSHDTWTIKKSNNGTIQMDRRLKVLVT
ncbi:hypothetical protein STEG23_004141 [Scotinomys teguina]